VRPRVFLVEGIDGSGKTTLATRIAEMLRTRGVPTFYFHCQGNEKLFGAMREYQESVLDNVEWSVRQLGTTVVLDRHWPSEIAYGSVMRNAPPMKASDFIERLKDLRCHYVHCHCGESFEIAQGKGDTKTREQHDQIVSLYGDIFHELRSQHELTVDYDLYSDGPEMDKWILKNLLLET
jgi:hypothetical protein